MTMMILYYVVYQSASTGFAQRQKNGAFESETFEYSSYDDFYLETTGSLIEHQFLRCHRSIYADVFESLGECPQLNACWWEKSFVRTRRLEQESGGRKIGRTLLLNML